VTAINAGAPCDKKGQLFFGDESQCVKHLGRVRQCHLHPFVAAVCGAKESQPVLAVTDQRVSQSWVVGVYDQGVDDDAVPQCHGKPIVDCLPTYAIGAAKNSSGANGIKGILAHRQAAHGNALQAIILPGDVLAT
jgi:hypothetical protein